MSIVLDDLILIGLGKEGPFGSFWLGAFRSLRKTLRDGIRKSTFGACERSIKGPFPAHAN